jgi:hypothetical protein
VDRRFKKLMPPLRRLVEVERALGKEADARWLELDLDDTEAILRSVVSSALAELLEEGVAGAGAAQKKLTRKQQKRKAAQRRKAEAAADSAAGGGGVNGDVVDGLAAVAAAQLSIEKLEPEGARARGVRHLPQ